MTIDAQKLGNAIWISKLAKQTGINSKGIISIIEYAGGIENIFDINEKSIIEIIGGPPEKIIKLSSYLKDKSIRIISFDEGKNQSKNGIMALSYTDTFYPKNLKVISAPPPILYILGENHEDILSKYYSVAVVGTRNPSPYGEAVTQKFVKDLVFKKVVIISGMARGIDSLAHKTAIENNGFTIAVLGCGLDIVYPPENRNLMQKINQSGLIISELIPGTPPIKSMFPARNRIISGLSDAVAIMEASKKSGTMITAGYAGEQGKDLFAVPGSIFSPNSSGTNQLIQDGACVLTNIDDMLWKLPMQNIQNFISPEINEQKLTSQKRIDEYEISRNDKNIITTNTNSINKNDIQNKSKNENTNNSNTNVIELNSNIKNPEIFSTKSNTNILCSESNFNIHSSESNPNIHCSESNFNIHCSESNSNNLSTRTVSNSNSKHNPDKEIRKILIHTEKTLDEISEKLGISVAKTSEILSFLELSGEIIFRNGRFSLTDSYK